MRKEKKTGAVKQLKPEPGACPLIVVQKLIPRIRTVKSKEKIKTTEPNSRITTEEATTPETSGNIMRLHVNLMPVLASAKEQKEEEEEEKEEGSSCISQKKPENGGKNYPSVSKSVELKRKSGDCNLGLTSQGTETKQPQRPPFVLTAKTQPKPAPEWGDRQRCSTPLPPICLYQQARTTATKVTADTPITGQESHSGSWMDNWLSSNTKSAEFHLPDISMSSLDVLLQAVTQKLKRKRGDDAARRRVQSDHVLVAPSHRHFGQQEGRPAFIEAVTKTSMCSRRVNRQMRLPPLLLPPEPPLILTLTKKNLWTSTLSR